MKYLLDTHVLLWLLEDDDKIEKDTYKIITDSSNLCYVSVVSLWEITIKVSLNKLKFDISFKELYFYLYNNNIEILNIDIFDLEVLKDLPFIHNDPFDRMLISQTINQNLILITKDLIIPKYPQINTLW